MIYAINNRTKDHRLLQASEAHKFGPDWDFVTANHDGWIKHDQSGVPVPMCSKVDVKFGEACNWHRRDATGLNWTCWESPWVVQYYRPILDEGRRSSYADLYSYDEERELINDVLEASGGGASLLDICRTMIEKGYRKQI